MKLERLGDRAVRFARPAISARAIVRGVKSWPGVVNVVVAREDVAVYFDRTPHVHADAIDALAAAPDEIASGKEHVLRVIYDGPDLEAVARATGLTAEEAVSLHVSGHYTVETMGFAPGFAYLDGLDARLVLPRRPTPRERVTAGSVAIAGAQTAVYPFDSPGGWHLLGRVSDVRMFDDHGPLLGLGDRVRFTR